MNFWEQLPRPIIGLSPMDGVTDAAFRLMVALHGTPDVSFTEFTSVGDICRGPVPVFNSFLYHECERPIVAQLYGKDPDYFYQAAHVVCELGFDGLDINMGCPSKNVASSGSGAGLIRTPDLAREILRATRQGIDDWAAGQSLSEAGVRSTRDRIIRDMNRRRSGMPTVIRRRIPLSVKTRIGFDADVVEPWIGLLLEEGPAAISIHGRTLQQMYKGEADWGAISRAAKLVEGTPTLLLGNGDVRSSGDIIQRVLETGVHGVLVGRGTLGRPWFFQKKGQIRLQIHRVQPQANGNKSADIPCTAEDTVPSLAERFSFMLEHARRFETLFGRERFPRMRKHLGWYCKGFPRAASMRAEMVRTCNSREVEHIVQKYETAQVCRTHACSDHASDAP